MDQFGAQQRMDEDTADIEHTPRPSTWVSTIAVLRPSCAARIAATAARTGSGATSVLVGHGPYPNGRVLVG